MHFYPTILEQKLNGKVKELPRFVHTNDKRRVTTLLGSVWRKLDSPVWQWHKHPHPVMPRLRSSYRAARLGFAKAQRREAKRYANVS